VEELLRRVLDDATDLGADFAEVRAGRAEGLSVRVQDRRADRLSAGTSVGAGIRVLLDGAWGFAPTNTLTPEELAAALRDALAMARAAAARGPGQGAVCPTEPVTAKATSKYKLDPRDIPLEDRVAAALEMEQVSRSVAPERTANVIIGYGDGVSHTTTANTYGTFVEQQTVRCGADCTVVTEQNGTRQYASQHRHTVIGYELIEGLDLEQFCADTARRAISLLSAEPAPAGKFPVVVNSRVCGILVHEAFGHNCEADAVWAGNSILEGKIGEQVASELITIKDDATLQGLNGWYAYDHEGTPAQRRTIVQEGTLCGFLHSLETAAQLGAEPTGSARAAGHHYVPLVRMSNTYMEAGDWTRDELLAEVKDGIFLEGGYHGYVFTVKGQFTCNAEHGYRIEGGELGQHLRNVSISGLTLEALKHVTAVGDHVEFGLGGTCGKAGQGMPIDAGGPDILISEVVVGGRN